MDIKVRQTVEYKRKEMIFEDVVKLKNAINFEIHFRS